MSNIFALAYMQVGKEQKLNKPNTWDLIIDRAIKIRHYFDIQARNEKIARNRSK